MLAINVTHIYTSYAVYIAYLPVNQLTFCPVPLTLDEPKPLHISHTFKIFSYIMYNITI